jgi:predicted nucleic acid-binding protein
VALEVFVDASFWTALFYGPDERHSQAENTWRQIDNSEWLAVTSNWPLYETLTHLCSRRRYDLAVQVLDLVSDSTSILIVRVEEAGLETRSLEIFRRHSDKRWSVVDCANFACIEQLQCQYALSYDRNFDQAQLEFKFQIFRF